MTFRRVAVVTSLIGLGAAPSQAQSLRALFERVSPSVVVVRTLGKALPSEPGAALVTEGGLGSGTIISADGRVLTAAHVVQTADKVGIELKDGRFFAATVIGSAPRADVALLKIDQPPPSLVPALLADSDSLHVGDDVAVIGAPWGFSYSLTVGHVSGLVRPNGTISGVPMELIQTDAAINQGNSGGPIFDFRGRVVGVVSHILTRSGGFEGLGFAVSANVARKLLLATRSVWTGVDGFLLTGAFAKLFNVPQPAGLLIQRVATGSPGDRLGLRPGAIPVKIGEQELILGGDIVLQVGDVEVNGDPDAEARANDYVRALPAGRLMEVKVLRDGQVLTLSTAPPR